MRDTDLDWIDIASREPFFGVLTNDKFLKANIDDMSLDQFWQSGFNDVDWQVEQFRAHYGHFEPVTALDFGCGVGRTTRAMAKIAQHVHGVDVAPAMLTEARKHAPANTTFHSVIPDIQVDWIHSLIVFQHIPPVRGMSLLAELLTHLAPGGVITIHITTYKNQNALSSEGWAGRYFTWDGERSKKLVDMPASVGCMAMYDYDMNQVLAIIHHANINRVTLQHIDHGGHHGVVIIGRRN